MRRFGILIAIALAPLTPGVSAQEVTAIVHGQVIDGYGGPPIADGVVLVRGDRILAVGAAGTVTVPEGARVIDARGRSVLPGLADLHVHLMGGWDGERVEMLGYQRYLNALLYAGITTVFDTGNNLPFVQQLRQEVAAGRIAGPVIRMTGPVLDGPDPVWPPISLAISSTSQIPDRVKQLKRAQVDLVKAYGGLSDPMLRVLVRAAAAESLRVVVDAWRGNGSAYTAQTGIAAFAHLGTTPVTEEAIALMRDRSIASITTLAVYESFSRRRLSDLEFLRHPLLQHTMPPGFIAELTEYATRSRTAQDSVRSGEAENRMRVAMANAKRLFDGGILLAAGTDAPYPGVFYGEGLHRELELLVEAGLTPLQAITVATRNAAVFLGKGEEWGTLEAGKRADVLIVAGDPARRIADTRSIERVMQAGRLLDLRALVLDPAKDPGFEAVAPVSGGA
jgi:imidazolonepropionase-like amidohydrolase